MKIYKITDKDGYTRQGHQGEMLWGENVTHKAKIKGKELCTNQVIHCYRDPYLAVLMNPSHGNYDFNTMLLWEAKGRIIADDGTKSGCKSLTTIKKIPVPQFTTEQLVEIAIRCAMKVYTDKKFLEWALNWITNKDRTANAAYVAAHAAYVANAAYVAANVANAVANAGVDLISIIREVIK